MRGATHEPGASAEARPEAIGAGADAPARRSRPYRGKGFHLFTYGTLRRDGAGAALLEGCEPVGPATITGTLYDIDGEYPALVLAGTGRVQGEIWRCPARVLARLDAYEDVADGLFRRVAAVVDGVACWVYVAGPKLARRLTPRRRIESGRWPPAGGA
jgi:gamma-glutamylcyclotransferase (GGCT)/AIG2-like uncharacterized protein YtfP